MRKPLIYSATAHVAILVATIVALPAPRLDPVPTRILPVELLTVAEMTNLKRQAKLEAQKPKPVETPKPKIAPEKPKPTPVPPTPEKVEPAPPQPEEKPEPIPDKKAEKKPEEKKKPEPPKPEQKKPEPVKKPAKKKPAFDPTNIAALLNKIPDTAAPPDKAEKSDEKADASETDNPDEPMTVSELDALRQKINRCFNAASSRRLRMRTSFLPISALSWLRTVRSWACLPSTSVDRVPPISWRSSRARRWSNVHLMTSFPGTNIRRGRM